MIAVSRPSGSGVRGVVFDLDGTLVDSFEGIATAANAARARFGLAPLPRPEITRSVGQGLDHLMEAVVGAARAAEGGAVFRSVYGSVCEDQTRAVPGAAQTLEALSARGIRMSVASNKPAAFSERILARVGLRRWLDAVEGPDTAGALKPDPAMIRACLRAMDVSAPEAIYVGDMPFDHEAGRRAGLPVWLVSGGAASEGALSATGRPVLRQLSDLVAAPGIDFVVREEAP